MSHLLNILFGQGTWGAGGNLVAWVLCGIPSLFLALWHHRRQLRADLKRLHHQKEQHEDNGHADKPERNQELH